MDGMVEIPIEPPIMKTLPETHGTLEVEGLTGLFVPEFLTPLAFTPLYGELSEVQRRRYNQIHGLYFMEQTIFFEQFMGKPALSWLALNAAPSLRKEAESFIVEEDRHTSWFRELLREIEPLQYGKRDFNLLGVSAVSLKLMGFVSRCIRLFPAVLWMQLIAEERALYFGRCFIEHSALIDPRFVALQRRHLADEPAHIRRDILFLEWLWPVTPRWLRCINAKFLCWSLREFFLLPKRSGWRVVNAWLSEFPELYERRAEFKNAMEALEFNQEFIHSLYPRAILPKTRMMAARWPEMLELENLFTD